MSLLPPSPPHHQRRAGAMADFALLLAAHTVYIYVLDGGKASKLQIPVLQLWGAIAASV